MGVEKGGLGYVEQARRLNVAMTERELVTAVGAGFVSPKSALRAINQADAEVRREVHRQLEVARVAHDQGAQWGWTFGRPDVRT